MKYLYTKSSLILLAALALAGCAKTDEFQSNPCSALEINSVSGISPFALMNAPTKAVIEGSALPAEEAAKGIGLFVTAPDGSAYDGHDKGYGNVAFTYSGSKWTTTTPVYLSNNTGKLYGYFPYNSNANDLKAVPVQSSIDGTDYLYATVQEVAYGSKPDIAMNHALARLHLTLKVNTEKYKAAGVLSKIKLKSDAIAQSGTMDITDGTVIPANPGEVSLAADGTITSEGITKDLLVVAGTDSDSSSDLTIILTVDGTAIGATIDGDSGIVISQGIQYDIEITLEDTGIKVSGVGVSDWGDGGGQTVEIKGHKVTLTLAEDVDPKDILTKAYVDGNNVIIRASSFQGKWLICKVEGDAKCEKVLTNDKFTFTISEISSDIEAVFDYSPKVKLTVSSDSNGKVWIGDAQDKTSILQIDPGQQVVIHAAPNENFRLFRWNDNDREGSRTITVGETDTTYSASFISADLIPGLFTVNSTTGKQVFFSKGNLYYDGEDLKFRFENNQYDTPPLTKNEEETSSHVGHFYWSSKVDVAISLEIYSDNNASADDIFFANNPESIEINGQTGWSVLTGNTGGEWDYLLNKRDGNRFANAMVHGMTGLLIFPDNYSGTLSGTGIAEVNSSIAVYPSGNIPEDIWTSMENAGVVFLPAAGFRIVDTDNDNPAKVSSVGNDGYYWPSTPDTDRNAYYLYFSSGNVDQRCFYRSLACSVRLVTE